MGEKKSESEGQSEWVGEGGSGSRWEGLGVGYQEDGLGEGVDERAS